MCDLFRVAMLLPDRDRFIRELARLLQIAELYMDVREIVERRRSKAVQP